MSTESRAAGHFNRRHFLAQQAFGLGGLALAWLLKEDRAFAVPSKPNLEPPHYDFTPKAAARPPQARAMISMFMQGGPSHIDLFDPKPALTKHHLQSYSGEIKYDDAAGASSKLFASPWKFHQRGECGMQLSELLPSLGTVADDICLIRSMHTGVNNHEQSIDALNTGRIQAGRPSLGSWLTYALGTESQNLPAFLVLTDPAGLPVGGVWNWQNGWLPSLYQGTVVRPVEPRILNLDPLPDFRGRAQPEFLSYLGRINAEHLDRHPHETDLDARIKSYELAARMQVAAKEALDISRESKAVHGLYGLDDPATREYGSRCLIARRMVERGVRFVQIFTGDQAWDHHNGIVASLPRMCRRTDKPAAALVRDLKSTGLLDTTLVHWGGEMGRLPVIENEKNIGRDHNTYGFSMWLAGGGVKGGCVYGETDEIGHKAAKNVVNHFDYHATLLHLFGLDEKQVTFERPGGSGSLIDGQPARVVRDILKRSQPA
ncbi:MAG TPA: DUF1501 domain-containing protein [Planctomycetaceae bacterium]|jgi:hypothetical protein|nr:DUF1501 domain-containing protein [Planctomycetaceae bacterium]